VKGIAEKEETLGTFVRPLVERHVEEVLQKSKEGKAIWKRFGKDTATID